MLKHLHHHHRIHGRMLRVYPRPAIVCDNDLQGFIKESIRAVRMEELLVEGYGRGGGIVEVEDEEEVGNGREVAGIGRGKGFKAGGSGMLRALHKEGPTKH